jgi:hypothetical protein
MARPPTPLQQGDLDGLCGAYALVNAVTRLLHNKGFDRDHANRLFQRLCHTLHRRQRMPEAVWRGTHIDDIDGMLRTVRRFVRANFTVNLVVTRPFDHGIPRKKDTFFRVLSESFNSISERKVAVIGLDRPGFHWTIATEVTGRSFRLYDSGRSKRLRYGDCTLGKTMRGRQTIVAQETRILSLEDVVPVQPRRLVAPWTSRRPALREPLRVAA